MAIRRSTKHRWKTRHLEIVQPDPSQLVLSARESLAASGSYIVGKIAAPHHLKWFPHIRTGESNEVLKYYAGENTDLLAPRGSAKAQPYSSLVHTPNGFKPMGSISVGDLVNNAHGLLSSVIAIHEHGEKDCYRVSFNDGTECECSDDHLWNVRNLAGGNPKEFKTLNLNHIRTKVFVKTSGKNDTVYRDASPHEKPWLDYRGYAKYHIPVADPLWMPKKDFVIHPYLMGILLGDGNLSKTSVRFTTFDIDIFCNVSEIIPEGYIVKRVGTDTTRGCYSITKIIGGYGENILLTALRRFGLHQKKSISKFVPKEYLTSSIEQRISLLQGLLDSDGTCHEGKIYYSSVSKQLIDDVVHLVQSLGGIARHHKPYAACYKNKLGEKVQCNVSYRISIKLPTHIKPFGLARKLVSYQPPVKYFPSRGIVNIEYIGKKKMRCIQTNSPSGLYLTDNFIVTHNSTWAAITAADIIGHNPHVQLLYLSNSRFIALRQSRLVKRIIESPRYREVFPKIRPGYRWADTDWEIDKEWAGVSTLDADATFTAAGITGSIVGQRTHVIFCDDLIKSSAAIAKENIREKMVYNFFEVVEPTLIPGGRIIDLGTLFRRDDIHKDFREAGWKIIQTSAIEKNAEGAEQTYWSRYKLELLQSLRERKPVIFTYQFQNEYPPEDEDVIIKPEWIKYSPLPDGIKFTKIAVGLDLAASEAELTNNDSTVFVVAGVEKTPTGNKFWLLDTRRGRWVGNEDKLRILHELYLDWYKYTSDFNFVPETNAYQRSLLGDYKTIFVQRWGITDVKVKHTSSKGDKAERLNGISGVFSNDLVRLNQAVNWHNVTSQLTGAEIEEDDDADATEKALNFLQRRKSSEVWSG